MRESQTPSEASTSAAPRLCDRSSVKVRSAGTAEQAADFKGFQRVDVSKVDVTGTSGSDNSWEALRARGHTYADNAQKKLGGVVGKNFRKEMTKAKRGTYRGGVMDMGAVNSVKFEY